MGATEVRGRDQRSTDRALCLEPMRHSSYNTLSFEKFVVAKPKKKREEKIHHKNIEDNDERNRVGIIASTLANRLRSIT